MKSWLRDDLAAVWGEQNPFDIVNAQKGVVYRDKEGRRTLRFELNGRGYFLKLHQGVGWKEIFKNLMQGRAPVLGASNEHDAIRKLERLKIDTLSIAGYGYRGINPATRLSFLITDELTSVESLEDFCGRWPLQPPTFDLKQKLIRRIATIARKLHAAGINHRDFYLCHFLLETNGNTITAENLDTKHLYLMDLHRAQIRASVPRRWLIKDLGALYYSALDIGLNRRDIYRFLRTYTQKSLRATLMDDSEFWLAVSERARRIYMRDHRREPQSQAWLPRLSLLEAFNAGRRNLPLNDPLELIVNGLEKTFTAESVPRLLPRKRVVMKGMLDNETVILKLFKRSRSGARNIQKEIAGAERVTKASIKSPALLGRCVTPCNNYEGLIYSYIANAAELSDGWLQFDDLQKQYWLDQIMRIMYALHEVGAYQDDIHANNFLLQEQTLYLLDLGSVKTTTAPLRRKQRLANLGQLIAQFTIGERALFKSALAWYAQQSQWPLDATLKSQLDQYIDIAWQARKRDYLGKALRVCSLTAYEHSLSRVWAYRRTWQCDDLVHFLEDPDAYLARGELIKAGNSATVTKAAINGQPVIIKRYNIKNWRHAVSRSLRPTRAEHSWRYAHLLELAGIDSCKPIAFLELRLGPLRSTAYFICEWIDAPDLLQVENQRSLTEVELNALHSLLQQMLACRLTHGDFKANNLLLRNNSIAMIDLDAMCEHSSDQSFRRALTRDLSRLLRNWPVDTPIHRQIKPMIDETLAQLGQL